jgi:hypothetical protein
LDKKKVVRLGHQTADQMADQKAEMRVASTVDQWAVQRAG